MSWGAWLLWGFASTLVLTSLMTLSQGLRLTRISLPYLVGTLFTPDRDRAKAVGFAVHLVNGWIFSLLYVLAFHVLGVATWRIGALIGFVHALFVLSAGMRLLPGVHPRMASERQGPSLLRQLEPPGLLALNYGYQTPVAILVAHLVFGAMLGGLYRVD